MPDPTTELTFTPATPRTVTDGVLFSVTGPVGRGQIQLADGNDRVFARSPEFGQKNRLSGDPNQQVWDLAITGSPNGGTFKLGVNDELNHKDYGSTGTIAYNADAAAIDTAIEAILSGEADVAVTGTGPFVITFGGVLASRGVSLTVTDNSLSGGTSPTPVLTPSTAEANPVVVAGGPYQWGPIYLPDKQSAIADVISTADFPDDGIYEGDSLLTGDVTVYTYSG